MVADVLLFGGHLNFTMLSLYSPILVSVLDVYFDSSLSRFRAKRHSDVEKELVELLLSVFQSSFSPFINRRATW